MAPFADAMRLVDREQGDVGFVQQALERLGRRPLGRDIEQVELAVAKRVPNGARILAGAGQRGGSKAEAVSTPYLVLHQRDQRRDDDAGALSGWFVMASCGLFPACVGWPVYYVHVPLFKTVDLKWPNGKSFSIHVKNDAEKNVYIQSIMLNGKKLERNWLTHDEIMQGGHLMITASDQPNTNWGLKNQWISELKTTE